ncbi:MAG: aminopeptidase P family protein [Verrucomicrobia bacterium]|nr:aminopeptidase P family protein [Kiritimatiellia bacterium]MCB1101581.1 aminopeptidase P family protein [Kiritimatiellia bacterium]MCP5488237.1 aminopeptidase P family protein [Verrucomicrobiota bacterium]
MMNRSTPPILLIESAEASANLLYASGFHAVDPVVLLDEGPRKTLVVPALEAGRAAQCRGIQVVTVGSLDLPADKRRSVTDWAWALLKRQGIRHVLVPAYFPVASAELLRKRRIRVEVAEGEIYPRRAVKTTREIRAIEEAQHATLTAMRKAIAEIRGASIGRDGVLRARGKVLTSESVRTLIQRTLLDHQYIGKEIIVAGGRQAADPHERGSGPLRAKETIVLDIFPRSQIHGYWGDATRTVLRGEASPVQRRMYRAVKQAQQLALHSIRAGVKGADIHRAVADSLLNAGFPTTIKGTVARGFFHGTGHGIGLDIHEAPSLSLADWTLEPGHVVTVEPGLYDPDHGGVRIEDVVVVTRNGCRVLGSCPKTFEMA